MIKIVPLIMLWLFSYGDTSAQQPVPKLPDGRPPVFQRELDTAESFFVAIEDADAVIHAAVERVVGYVTNDAFKEPFSILYLNGTVATGEGGEPLPQSYRLRVPGSWAANKLSVYDTEWVFFIKNNREEYDPIRRLHPVRLGVVYAHTDSKKPIKSIDERGYFQIGKRSSGKGITPDTMIDMASKYLAKHNYSVPNLALGLKPVDHNKSLRTDHRLDKRSDFSDDVFRHFMDQFDDDQWVKIRTVEPKDDRKMISFVKRELARGKSVNDLHRFAKVVLPFFQH